MNTINSSLFRILIFFRIVDPFDNNLSISNIACIITLYKLFSSPVTSYEDVGSVMLALSNYGWKKYLNVKNINQAVDVVNNVTKAADNLTEKEK